MSKVSYENKEYILQFFEGVHEKDNKAELLEVYRKAEAFDEVIDLYVNGSNKYLQTKRHTLDVFIEDVAEILKPFTDKYESGEYDA